MLACYVMLSCIIGIQGQYLVFSNTYTVQVYCVSKCVNKPVRYLALAMPWTVYFPGQLSNYCPLGQNIISKLTESKLGIILATGFIQDSSRALISCKALHFESHGRGARLQTKRLVSSNSCIRISSSAKYMEGAKVTLACLSRN